MAAERRHPAGMGDQPGNREESRMTCKPYDIPKNLIWEAWLHVKANQGAAGIDAETIERLSSRKVGAGGNRRYQTSVREEAGRQPVKTLEPHEWGAARIVETPG